MLVELTKRAAVTTDREVATALALSTRSCMPRSAAVLISPSTLGTAWPAKKTTKRLHDDSLGRCATADVDGPWELMVCPWSSRGEGSRIRKLTWRYPESHH